MKIRIYQCPICKDWIFSRAHHDFRRCTCGNIFVDGGFRYTRIGFDKKLPESMVVNMKQTKEELYDDWNLNRNLFGLIKDGSVK